MPQYTDYINKHRIHRVIEGGVHHGENTAEFASFADRVYGFEPNKSNFNYCIGRPKIKELSNRIELFNQALWSKDCDLYVSEEAGLSRTYAGIESNVKARTIDSFVAEKCIKVDFIKLDCEGAEMEILEGAAHIIKNHKPQMAISIYHSISDLYEIPAFILKLNPTKSIRFHHYDDYRIRETIMYILN